MPLNISDPECSGEDCEEKVRSAIGRHGDDPLCYACQREGNDE